MQDDEKLTPVLMVMRKGDDYKCHLDLDNNPIENPSSHITVLENIFLTIMKNHPEFAEIMISAVVRYTEPVRKMVFKEKS